MLRAEYWPPRPLTTTKRVHEVNFRVTHRVEPKDFIQRGQGLEIRGVSWEPDRHHGVTPEQVRTFRPDVCCDHDWEHFLTDVRGRQDVCAKCGAFALRGRDGQIEEYEAAVGG